MFNYIKAELYRNFNRVYFYAFTVCISLFALISNIFFLNVENIALDEMMKMSFEMLSVPVFLVLIIVDIVTSEEQKNLTVKNVLVFGLPRSKMYISKIIAATILSVISAIVILTVFLGSGAVILGLGESFSSDLVRDFTCRILSAVPLWIGTISICTFLAFLIKNNTIFAVTYVVLFNFTSLILNILGFLVSDKFFYIKEYLISSQLSILSSENITNTGLSTAACIGFAYIIIFTVLGVIFVRRKEIK